MVPDNNTPPGWYPDPSNPLQERLWDGEEWIEKTRPRQPQVVPAPIARAVVPAPADYTPTYAPTYSPAAEPERSTFGGAVREGFSRFADFDGRSSVSAYWNFWLFSVVAIFGSALLLGPLAVLVFIMFLFPGFSFAVRRLHDRGKSGAYLLLNLLPVIGTLMVLVELAGSGEAGPNQYGQQPGTSTAVGGPVRVGQPMTAQPPQTPGQGPAGGVILYDTGIPGDPNRYLEVAPVGWNRTPDDPMWAWDEATKYLGTNPATMAAGWRLPTASEASWFKKNRRSIPGLAKDYYWTGDVYRGKYSFAFEPWWITTSSYTKPRKWNKSARVRPVRSLNSDGVPVRGQPNAPYIDQSSPKRTY